MFARLSSSSRISRRQGPGGAVALALQSQAVGAVSEPVEGGGAEQSVGEGVAPLGEVEVGGDDGRALVIALGDEVVEVLVRRRTQGFEAEVIDDEQRHERRRGRALVRCETFRCRTVRR